MPETKLKIHQLKSFLQFTRNRTILKEVILSYLTEVKTPGNNAIGSSLNKINFNLQIADLQEQLFIFLNQFPDFEFEHLREIELKYVIHTANGSNSGWVGYSFGADIFDPIDEDVQKKTNTRTKSRSSKTRNKEFNNTVLNEQLDYAWAQNNEDLYLEKMQGHGYNWFRLEKINQRSVTKRNPANYFIADWDERKVLLKTSNSNEMNEIFNREMNLGLNLNHFKLKKRKNKENTATFNDSKNQTNITNLDTTNVTVSSVLTDKTSIAVNASSMNVSKAFARLDKNRKKTTETELSQLSQRLEDSEVQSMLSPKKKSTTGKKSSADSDLNEEQAKLKKAKKLLEGIDNKLVIEFKDGDIKGVKMQMKPVEPEMNLYQALVVLGCKFKHISYFIF